MAYNNQLVSDTVWKPVPSLNNEYEVSNCGDIRRVSVKTKLSLEDEDTIRSYREAGRSYPSIAKEFGVTKMAIKKMLRPRLFSFRTPFRQLKSQRNSNGYPMLRLCVDGVPRTCVVHRLIAEAFFGPVPKGMEINHKNGKRDDNRLENLEIVTPSENALHGIHVLGGKRVSPKGSANHLSKLKESEVAEIRALRATGRTLLSIGKQFGVSLQTVHRIVSGKAWKHCL